ncbi:DUF6090 family protein [Aegicerativicinus sediminis]|uniref:DUF6090 family protein n=1 Tax=Aegicerativicinus sediminis TaxID=2893202 RepID=UPI001E2A45D4|nr:DUF6090 family protein [Aegicerativicinus sediminis]
MIKFFRNIRQNLLSENKFTRYFIYAIGEVILVVIGILIALQINNANDISKQKQKAINYNKTLINELRTDLDRLNQLDTMCFLKRKEITNYLSYFINPDKGIDVLIQKMPDVSYFGDYYQSIAYTVDDIINTGSLEIFSDKTKHAILEFKAVQDFYEKNRAEVVQKWVLSDLEFENAVDMLSFYETPTNRSENPNDWRLDLNSDQYRLFNNRALSLLRTYHFRIDQNEKARQSIEKLLHVLEE